MAVTPGIEEGGFRLDSVRDALRDEWKKLIECEERLRFWKQMVGRDLSVREVTHLGEDLKNKFRSEAMKGGDAEKEVVRLMMRLKLKDERRHHRELKARRNLKRKELENVIVSPRQINKISKMLNGEAARYRKVERKKYSDKANHLNRIRELEEEKKLEECPKEIYEYKDIIVFNKLEMEKLSKEKVEISKIGEVDLDEDERALLKLPPKFAMRKNLSTVNMRADLEMGAAKVRYQVSAR